MTYIKETIKCPKCNKNIRIKIKKELNENDFSSIINRDIFKYKCDNCSNEVLIDYPFIFEVENYSVIYKTSEQKENHDKKFLRICTDFDEVKEKILIFHAGLNDIMIEFIKKYIESLLEKERCFLRFDSVDDTNIVFYELDEKEYLGFSLDNYKKLLDHSKIKKLAGYVEINSDNFHKYIKVRS